MHSTPRRSALFEQVLPAGPLVRELRGAEHPAPLLPEEERVVASAVAARRREFAAGRACARAALERFGIAPGPILPGPGRAPVWPPSMVGSITHCAGLAAAAVAAADTWWAVGIDAEPAEALPAGVVDLVMSAAERAALAELPDSGIPWDRVVFSAKESLYKVWFPLRRDWLGFEDAVVRLSEDGGFSARLLPREIGRLPREVEGRWVVAGGFIATAVALPRGLPTRSGPERGRTWDSDLLIL